MAGGATSFSRFPEGLLELLNSKHLGTAPNELSDVVAGSVDMFPFWTKGLIDSRAATGTVQNVGDVLTNVVPEGQLWIPLFVAGNVVAGAAGEDIRMSLFIRLLGTAFNVRFATSRDLTAVAIGDNLQFAVEIRERIVLSPGATIGFGLDMSTLTAARTSSTAALVVRIPTT